MTEAKSVIVIYINRDVYKNGEDRQLLELTKKYNMDTINESIQGGSPVIIMTTIDEATRVEKIDFDKPFPLRPPRGTTYADLEDQVMEEEKKRLVEELKKQREKLEEELNLSVGQSMKAKLAKELGLEEEEKKEESTQETQEEKKNEA